MHHYNSKNSTNHSTITDTTIHQYNIAILQPTEQKHTNIIMKKVLPTAQ
jgi:hypothetical protein